MMDGRADELANLRRTLASLTEQVTAVGAAVDRLAAQTADTAPAADPVSGGAPVSGADPVSGEFMTTPQVWPVPLGAVPAAPVPPSPVGPPAPVPPALLQPAPVPSAPVGPPGAYLPLRPYPAVSPQSDQRRDGSWADTSGLKILGWVGGGITLLGVVMLLVVAAQQGYFGPVARVVTGFALGVVLVAAGVWTHRKPDHDWLAITLVSTGLGVGYLTTVGAVQLAELLHPLVGHVIAVGIVAGAVTIARRWQRHLLATVSFAIAGFAAPIVAGGYSWDVFLFVAIMVAGGAALLIAGLEAAVWIAAAGVGAVTVFIGLAAEPVTPTILWLTLMMGLGVWALFLVRLVTGRAPADPGPFPIRPRATDPDQIARDYADFHAHQRLVQRARTERSVTTSSLAIAVALMALALAWAQPAWERDIGIGLITAALTVLAGVTAWAVGREHSSVRVVAWLATILYAAIALLRLLEGDIRSVSWMVLATVVLVIIGVERMRGTLLASLGLAFVSLLAASPALGPAELVDWPGTSLLDGGVLVSRAWTAVLPAGICVLALTAAAWWATSRITAARAKELSEQVARGMVPSTVNPAGIEQERTTIMAWTLICCAIVACYGLMAITMVLSYAVSPTFTGYQVGQIIVTLFVTLAALALLWQGFRTMLLRLGGLGLAAVAVAKLLLADTRMLAALPRAATVIAVGLLLLIGAFFYMRALGRANSASLAGAEPVHAESQA